jgi:predicted ATPase
MFKSMRLQNFKAYKDSGEVSLAPLTVIVGANNSGKSTLFHALLLLKQTAQNPEQRPLLATQGPFVDLGGFYDILHKDATNQPSFEISITLDDPITVHVESGLSGGRKFETTPDRFDGAFALAKKSGGIEVCRATFWLGSKRMLAVSGGNGKWQSEMFSENAPRGAEIVYRNIFPRLSISFAPGAPVPKLDRAFMRTVDATNIGSYVWTESLRSNVHHVGPLRRRVPWQASLGARTSDLGLGGENLLAALSNEAKEQITHKNLLESLNAWLFDNKILTKLHLEVDKARASYMLLGDEWRGTKGINIAGMGEGVSQVLPVVARSMAANANECLLFEQPEIHLHPALQAELADLFIEIIQSGSRQVLVETHSEHLLLRVRRRIAEGTLKPDQVAILFVEKQGGGSKVRRLDLNSRGHFSDWPKGFFDDAYQEAMALANAASRKG